MSERNNTPFSKLQDVVTDAPSFEEALMDLASMARETFRESGDPAWDRTATCLNQAWIAVQERKGN